MARSNWTLGTNELISGTSGGVPLTTWPHSYVFWEEGSGGGATQVFWSICDSTDSGNRTGMWVSSGVLYGNYSNQSDATSLGYSATDWQMFGCSAHSTTDRDYFRGVTNGVAPSISNHTTTMALNGSADRWSAGIICDLTPSSSLHSTKHLARIAFWDGYDLTSEEIDAMWLDGVDPLQIAPNYLSTYCRMDGTGDELDIIGGMHLIETGTITRTANPPRWRGRPRVWNIPFEVAGDRVAGDRVLLATGSDVALLGTALGDHWAIEPPATPSDVEGLEATLNSDLIELDSTTGDIVLLGTGVASDPILANRIASIERGSAPIATSNLGGVLSG